jgi:outer membrane protein OmpA-like peptidoglycan-associated protein
MRSSNDTHSFFRLLTAIRTRMDRRRPGLCGLGLFVVALSTPCTTQAQLWDRIKSNAAESLEEHKARADSSLEEAAVRAVDSSLEKTGRGLDSGITSVGRVVDTTLNRIEGTAYGMFQGDGKKAETFAHALASGSLVLREIQFETNSLELTPEGQQVLEQLAEAVRATPGTFLIEGYTDTPGDSAATQALSENRAAAVKASLIGAGIPASRLFAKGRGAGQDRVELSRML